MIRIVTCVLIALLLLLIGCYQHPGQHAEAAAREHMVNIIGAPAVNRAHIQTRTSANGWMVIFHHANASCSESSLWRGACRFSSDDVHKHLYVCVDHDSKIGLIGSRRDQIALWEADLCQK